MFDYCAADRRGGDHDCGTVLGFAEVADRRDSGMTKRLYSVDILRAVAILLMIQVHFVGNLSSRPPSGSLLFNLSSWLGIWPAPLFTMLVGLSYSLWLDKQRALGAAADRIVKFSIRRGIFLFGAGIAFAVFIWSPEETFNWDILPLIGVSLLILAAARKLPPVVLLTICLMVLLLAPPLRQVSDFTAYWKAEEYIYDFTMTDVVLGFLLNGYFPLLPWIIFPLVGYSIGETFFRQDCRSRFPASKLSIIGGALLALAAILLMLQRFMPAAIANFYLTDVTFYPASTTYIIGMLGLSMLTLGLLHSRLDCCLSFTGKGRILRFFQRYSAFAFTVYIVHHMAHLWPLWLYGVWKGEDDPTEYWRQAMSVPLAFGLAIVFIAAFSFVLVWLERRKKWSFEALMRWVCE
jgi:uncharacterized membrane protein